jgi:hypothetical protein
MVPNYYEANFHANKLRHLFALGANGVEEANKAFEKDRLLALSALGIFDHDMRHGDITFETPEVNQLLDYVETTYDLCFSPEALVPDGAYWHRRGLESWMHRLAAKQNQKTS